MSRSITTILLSFAISLLASHPACAAKITIPTVSIGNLGNTNDPATGNKYGGVGYAYRIGTTEVTVGQYVAFLNAVAATDTYALYNKSMASDHNIAGILRTGSSGSYFYSAIGSAKQPVTYVSWGDAARFANWMHNGQPIGAENSVSTEDGAYELNGATTLIDYVAISRKADAQWFLPKENEWYKAAYHKNDGVSGNYWAFPTSTSTPPYSDQPPGNGAPTKSNTANFYSNDRSANGYDDGYAVTGATGLDFFQNYLTDAEAFTDSMSPYGTFDQGGNVGEWNEDLINVGFRVIRGGDWSLGWDHLSSSRKGADLPMDESPYVGFRVATVPEPDTGMLAILGLISSAVWNWRRQSWRSRVADPAKSGEQ